MKWFVLATVIATGIFVVAQLGTAEPEELPEPGDSGEVYVGDTANLTMEDNAFATIVVDADCISIEKAVASTAVAEVKQPKHPLIGRCVDWKADNPQILMIEFDAPGGKKIAMWRPKSAKLESLFKSNQWRIRGKIDDVKDRYSGDEIWVDGSLDLVPQE